MEDLRSDFNTKKPDFNLAIWWENNRRWIKATVGIILIVFTTTQPELIGTYSAWWLETLYTNFIKISSMPLLHWGIIMGTLFTSAVIYKILEKKFKY